MLLLKPTDIHKGSIAYLTVAVPNVPLSGCSILVVVSDVHRPPNDWDTPLNPIDKVEVSPVAGDGTCFWVSVNTLFEQEIV